MFPSPIQASVGNVMKLADLTGLFVSLCSIQQPDGVPIDAGQPSGNYLPIAGLQNIPCTAPPVSSARLQATEVRAADDIQAFAPRHILLNGFYPSIQQGVADGWIALIDGVQYTLMGAENDSQSQMTRLMVRFAGV